ncbi:MAG: phosphotransferase [Propionibacteriaceae bacterium]|jgi:maltokinase|nr:phosphotransferase [Propionibacteriaceae bacterium]
MMPPTLWLNRLTQARWFGSKGLTVQTLNLQPLDWYVSEGEVWVRSELAEVALAESTETYHLLVGYLPLGSAEAEALVGQVDLPGRGWVDIVDAPYSPQAMSALLQALAKREIAGLTWFDTLPDPASPTEVFTGEQSNTTVKVGEEVLFKIFRKPSKGPNLEAQMLAALAGSPIVPRLIGTLSSPDRGWDLGLFSARIDQAEDGWNFATAARAADRPINDEMNGLGRALRQLHNQLAEVFGTWLVDSQVISHQILARIDKACAELPELQSLSQLLRPNLDLTAVAVPIQRIHGDFHLGQALISPTGWTIIDFEGEPAKTPQERVTPDSVWRDLAGLSRSLDYAWRSAKPSGGVKREWLAEARSAFLAGYLGTQPLQRELLTAYEIDKAIYEFVYEARNRPAWVDIPRQALLEIVLGSN